MLEASDSHPLRFRSHAFELVFIILC